MEFVYVDQWGQTTSALVVYANISSAEESTDISIETERNGKKEKEGKKQFH